MSRKLIVDAGSTKVEWVLINSEGTIHFQGRSKGLNAFLGNSSFISSLFSEIKKEIQDADENLDIFYYGAGCATETVCNNVKNIIAQFWPHAQISVESDLLGAARALFKAKKGIACILGTGSNSCLYINGEIKEQIPSLGYILGDEGSGAALGKRLISDSLKKQLPEDIVEEFFTEYSLSLPVILEKVYNEPYANTFLASFSPYLKKNLWRPEIYSLVLKELASFIKRNVAKYKEAQSIPVGFVGSIARNFEKVLKEAASSFGYSVNHIEESPIPGLIEFHSSIQI